MVTALAIADALATGDPPPLNLLTDGTRNPRAIRAQELSPPAKRR
jgi:hypothetical protein